MKKFILLISCLLLIGCASNKLTNESVNSWLALKQGDTTHNITGMWDSGDMMGGGWGVLSVSQERGKLTGTMGVYDVRGVIVEDKVYLSLYNKSREVDYYTCIADVINEDRIDGKCIYGDYVDGQDIKDSTPHPLLLIRHKR